MFLTTAVERITHRRPSPQSEPKRRPVNKENNSVHCKSINRVCCSVKKDKTSGASRSAVRTKTEVRNNDNKTKRTGGLPRKSFYAMSASAAPSSTVFFSGGNENWDPENKKKQELSVQMANTKGRSNTRKQATTWALLPPGHVSIAVLFFCLGPWLRHLNRQDMRARTVAQGCCADITTQARHEACRLRRSHTRKAPQSFR